MKSVLGIWTALCFLALVAVFFAAPAWQTETDGFLSGGEVFGAVALLILAAWIVGVGAILLIGPLAAALTRRVGPWPTVGVFAVLASIVAFAGVQLARDGDQTENSFVSFNTADSDPDWSPDGRSVAFVTNRGEGGIYVIRTDGSGMHRVFRGEASGVDWSPDGRQLVFAGAHGIYVLSASGGQASLVLRRTDVSLPTWAPNGRELALVREEPGVFQSYNGRFHDTAPAIYVVRLDGHSFRRLLSRYRGAVGDGRPGSEAAVSETAPTWSPDGRRIAFEAGDGVIVAADVESGRRVTISGERAGYEPAWSPDGRLIVYQCEGDVCVASSDGSGDEHRIAVSGGAPSWSPDSRLIVFEHYLYEGTVWGAHPRALEIVGADGSDLRKLTFGPSRANG